MPITVSHEVNPELAGAASFQVGQNLARLRDRDRSDKINAQRDELDFRAAEAEQQRLLRREELQAQMARDKQRGESFLAQEKLKQAGMLQNTELREAGALDQIAARGEQEQLKPKKYSAEARQKLDKVQRAMNWVKQTPTLTPKQKESAMGKLQKDMLLLKSDERPPWEESPYPEGQRIGDIWSSDGSQNLPEGWVFTRDKDGVPKLIGRPDQSAITLTNFNKTYDDVYQSLTVENKKTGVIDRPSPLEVQRTVKARMKMFEELSKPSPVPGGGGGPGGPGFGFPDPRMGSMGPPPEMQGPSGIPSYFDNADQQPDPNSPLPGPPTGQPAPAPPPPPEKNDWKADVGKSAAAEGVRKLIFENGMLVDSPEVEKAVEKMSPEELDRFLRHPAIVEMALDAARRQAGMGETESQVLPKEDQFWSMPDLLRK